MQDVAAVAIVGRPRHIVFPAVCPNCTRPARVRLRIQKVFVGEDGETRTQIQSFAPYFCEGCAAIHEKEARPDAWLPLKRILHGWVLWFPIAGSFIAGAWMMGQSFPLRALAALFWGITAWCCFFLWWQTRHLAVQPPTSITSAVDFTHDLSDPFEPQWRRFTFRNIEYAGHFRQANENRLWSRHHPAARRAATLRYYGSWLLGAALVIAGVFWAADELNIPLWDYIVKTFR